MDVDLARGWLIKASLVATGAAFVFFLVAPAVGYPLTWNQSMRVFEIVLPVFLSYLGTATHFLFHSNNRRDKPVTVNPSSISLLGLLVRGPIIVFGVASIAIIFAFGFSNRASSPERGTGMSPDMLTWSFTAALGLLTVTTNVVVAYLFSATRKAGGRQPRNSSRVSGAPET
jgi:hypothetical protein